MLYFPANSVQESAQVSSRSRIIWSSRVAVDRVRSDELKARPDVRLLLTVRFSGKEPAAHTGLEARVRVEVRLEGGSQDRSIELELDLYA